MLVMKMKTNSNFVQFPVAFIYIYMLKQFFLQINPFMKYLILLVLFFANASQAQYRLILNLQKGNTYFQRTSSNLTIEEEVNNQKLNINTTVSGAMSFKVLDKSESYYELEVAYTELGMTMKTANGEMSFSSMKPYDEKDIFSRLLLKMVKHPFHITMQSNGMIKQVSGIDSLWANLITELPELDEAKKTQILDQLKQSYGENSIRGNIEQLTAIFPAEKVRLNDQWQNTIQLKSTMSATVTNHYKLVGYNEQDIDIENHADTKTKEDTTQINGLPATYRLSGVTDSKIKIDTRTGWISEATINQDLKGNIEIIDNPKVPGGMSIPMEIQSMTKVSNK